MLNEDACWFLNIQDRQTQVRLLEHDMHINLQNTVAVSYYN
jgi:hypothetical protein